MDIARIATSGIAQQLQGLKPSLEQLGEVKPALEQLGSGKPAPELPGHSGAFADLLQHSLERVNGLQHDADAAARAFALGQAPSVHDTMIAMEKADISLRLTTKVRNKVVEAYQDIMRMQV